MEEKLLSVDELANRLGVGTRTVWRWRDAGRLPGAIRIAGTIRWRSGDISAWIAEGCPAPRQAVSVVGARRRGGR